MAAPKSERAEPRSPEDLEAEIEQLKAEIAQLAKQVQQVGEHSLGTAKRAAAAGIGQMRAQGEETLENLRSKGAELEDQLAAAVREKPVTSLAIAVGVGFLFALMSRR